MSYSKRRRVIAGKTGKCHEAGETRAFFAAFNPLVAGVTDCDIVIAASVDEIPAAVEATKGHTHRHLRQTFIGKGRRVHGRNFRVHVAQAGAATRL